MNLTDEIETDEELLINNNKGELISHKFELFQRLEYRQIIIKVVEFMGLIYLIFGIIVAYGWACRDLDVRSIEKNETLIFWEPIATIFSLVNLFIFVISGFHKYQDYKNGRIKFFNRPGNQIIVCFILVPLYFISAIYMIITIIRDIAIIPCKGYMTFSIPISLLLIITSAAILVLDIGQNNQDNFDWLSEMMKTNIIFFTIIGVINCLVINLALQHMLIFQNESRNSSYGKYFQLNMTCINSKSLGKNINDILIKYDQNLRPMLILFCVCSISYLIQPLFNKRSEVLKFENDTTQQPVQNTQAEENLMINLSASQNPSFRLPSASLVICIIFLSLSFLAFIIVLSLKKTKPLNIIGNIIFISLSIIIYIVGIGLTVVHIKEVLRWPIFFDRRGKVIDNCLVWIGAGGQLAVGLAEITQAIDLLNSNRSWRGIQKAVDTLSIIVSVLMIVQIFCQTILVSISLDRKWIKPELNSWAESLCPAVGMMGLNVGLLLLSAADLKNSILIRSERFFIDLFTNALHSIGETLASLQRLHASLYFASMILYTHN